jgi:trimeric autotransporter adhesin
VNHPEDVATDAAGNLYIADYFNNLVRKVDSQGIIQTVAGTRSGMTTIFGGLLGGFGGDEGPATDAQLNNPIKLSVDEAGTIYIADSNNRRIRSVAADGIMHTVAGNGGAGGTDFSPRYVVSDAANVYVAPITGGIVQRVNEDGSLTTVAGNGDYGFSGDSAPSVDASLSNPTGLALDRDGNLYIADSGNHRVRRVTPDGLITTVAGSGFSGFSGDDAAAFAAELNFPTAVAIDDDGNLYIADTGNQRVRKVTPDGIIHTVAGDGTTGFAGDGVATSLPLSSPNGLAVEHSGTLLISDGYNFRIRRLTPDGQIHTIAGNGQSYYSGEGQQAIKSSLAPWGLATDSDNNIYVAAANNQRVLKISPDGVN